MNESRRQPGIRPLSALSARGEIAGGRLRGQHLFELIRRTPREEREAFTDAVLGFDEEAPPDTPELPRGGVPYLPCGVDEIVSMVLEVPVRAEDQLVDLGAGLGRVVILAHLLSGARAIGVEVQGELVRRARASAEALGLDDVSFLHANATDLELDGTVFFLYAPFNGETMTKVLRRLEETARRHPIVVAAVGVEFREVPWLSPRPRTHPELTLYDSSSHSRVGATA